MRSGAHAAVFGCSSSYQLPVTVSATGATPDHALGSLTMDPALAQGGAPPGNLEAGVTAAAILACSAAAPGPRPYWHAK